MNLWISFILQIGTGYILNDKYKVVINDKIKYSSDGYKYVLWLSSLISTMLGMFGIMLAKDTKGPGKYNCCFCGFSNEKPQIISPISFSNVDDNDDEEVIDGQIGNSSNYFNSDTIKGEIKFHLID